MNKNLAAAACVLLLLAAACGDGGQNHKEDTVSKSKWNEPADSRQSATGKERDVRGQALIDAYPDFIKDVSDNKVIFKDGSEIVFDDGKEKDFLARLDDSDVEDMFYDVYRLPDGAPRYLEDAGRSRCESLYKKMYGDSEAAVRNNLVNVEWEGETVKFTRVNGAADSLMAVAREVDQHPDLKDYLKSSGTFYWRPVRGARRLSAHSYGIAFDVAVAKSDYWQWNGKTNDEMAKVEYANKIPRKLVDIFQRHGFIWGGAWYHYDTMHFEFRPDILNYARSKGTI